MTIDKNTKMFIEQELIAVKPLPEFPKYGISIVLKSAHAHSKHVALSAEQFTAIEKILLGEF